MNPQGASPTSHCPSTRSTCGRASLASTCPRSNGEPPRHVSPGRGRLVADKSQCRFPRHSGPTRHSPTGACRRVFSGIRYHPQRGGSRRDGERQERSRDRHEHPESVQFHPTLLRPLPKQRLARVIVILQLFVPVVNRLRLRNLPRLIQRLHHLLRQRPLLQVI